MKILIFCNKFKILFKCLIFFSALETGSPSWWRCRVGCLISARPSFAGIASLTSQAPSISGLINLQLNLGPRLRLQSSGPPPYLLLSGFCSTLIFMHDKAHKSLLTKTVRPTSGPQYPWSSKFSFYCSPAFVEFFMRCFQSTALLWGGKVFIKIWLKINYWLLKMISFGQIDVVARTSSVGEIVKVNGQGTSLSSKFRQKQ